jgi:hypothetical protein
MKVETHSCVGSVGEVVFTCSALGFLHRWEGRNLMSSVRGHTSGIRTCYVLRGQGDEQVQMQPCKRSNLPSCMYGMVCMHAGIGDWLQLWKSGCVDEQAGGEGPLLACLVLSSRSDRLCCAARCGV